MRKTKKECDLQNNFRGWNYNVCSRRKTQLKDISDVNPALQSQWIMKMVCSLTLDGMLSDFDKNKVLLIHAKDNSFSRVKGIKIAKYVPKSIELSGHCHGRIYIKFWQSPRGLLRPWFSFLSFDYGCSWGLGIFIQPHNPHAKRCFFSHLI